jgi:hypothetical protein
MSKHNDLIIDDDEDDIEGFESYLDEMMEDDLPQMKRLSEKGDTSWMSSKKCGFFKSAIL